MLGGRDLRRLLLMDADYKTTCGGSGRCVASIGAQFMHDANSVLRAAVDLALTELPNDEEVRACLWVYVWVGAACGERLRQQLSVLNRLTGGGNCQAVVTTPRGHRCGAVVFEDDVKVVGVSIAKTPEVNKRCVVRS